MRRGKKGKTINLTQKHLLLKHLQLKMKVLYLLTDLWYNTAKLDPCFPFYLLNRMKKMDPVKVGCIVP